MRRFLFEYPFCGETYGFEITANDATEAEQRVKAMPWAKYKGEIFATIPASPRSFCRWLWRR
jgi:hypothetical protein